MCYLPAPMSAAKKSRSARGAKSASAGARKKTAAKKTAKKPAVKRTTAKKKTARKAAARKTAGKKTAAKKTRARKTTARKAASGRGSARAAKKSTRKKTAKKTAAKRTAPRKTSAPKAPPKRRTRPAKLDKKTLAAIREKLGGEKVELETQLDEIQRNSRTESEDIGLHEDFADAGTSTFERERDLSIRNNVLDLLDQVTRALNRIDEGNYGTCENCGRPIDAARIKAFPRVLMCLDCKRRDERTR